MHVQILGPGCANCLKLEVEVMQVLTELGLRQVSIEQVSTPREMERLMTSDPPGLAIDGQLVWSGGKELPTQLQIANWIGQAAPASV